MLNKKKKEKKRKEKIIQIRKVSRKDKKKVGRNSNFLIWSIRNCIKEIQI